LDKDNIFILGPRYTLMIMMICLAVVVFIEFKIFMAS